MPQIEKIPILSKDIDYFLWNIEEDEETLLSLCPPLTFERNERNWRNFNSIARRKEFLATRCLLAQILGKEAQIEYDQLGAPHLSTHPTLQLSISHSHGIVAISLSSKIHGIDIEKVSKKAKRCHQWFLHPSEKKLAQTELEYTTLWCAKEAIFKAASYFNKSLDFQNDIIINQQEQQQLAHTPIATFKLASSYLEFYHLAICLATLNEL